jgi:flavin-binding protein dodecin
MSVYKVIELVGTSRTSWEDAANEAIETAKKSLRELRIAEVVKMDVRLDDGDFVEYRVRMNVSFKYED